MANKPKTLTCIEPNAGLNAALQKKLIASSRKFMQEIALQIFEDLRDNGLLHEVQEPEPMAADARIRLTPYQRRIVSKVQATSPKLAAQRLDTYTAGHISRWLIQAEEEARKVSYWFVRSVAQSVTSSQRKALTDAGISKASLRQKWRVPFVKGGYISEQAAKEIPDIVDSMTELITKMHADDLARLRDVISEGVTNGQSLKQIETTLQAAHGFTQTRAKNVALDQSNKINNSIQTANAKALGVSEAYWVHVPGRYTSRATHVAMNGKLFDLSKGLYDSDVGRYVVPTELPYCRCQWRMKLPDDLLE